MLAHPRTIIIIGLLRSGFDPQELAKQGSLFYAPRWLQGTFAPKSSRQAILPRQENGEEVNQCAGGAAVGVPSFGYWVATLDIGADFG